MTTVNPAATSAAASTSSTGTGSALNKLSGNFDTFLQLLTTQLQNQDPTSPMNTNQFTQQLVEFSQVEQQISTNSNLHSLIDQGKAQSTSNAVTNGAVNWTYSLDANASSNTLTVTDAKGKIVYTGQGQTGAGAHQFNWDGKDNVGNQLPDGAYTLTVSPKTGDGSTVNSAVASSGKVTQVDLTGTTPQLMIGTTEFPLTDVSAVASI
jgi:flagellar basal-body rod modification protein FlgD